MPSLGKLIVPPLPPATSQAAVAAIADSWPIDYVKEVLLTVTRSLLSIEAQTTLWKTTPADPYTISLETLSDRLHKGNLSPSPLKHQLNDPQNVQSSIHLRTNKKPICRPLEDFEDMYYASLAKIQEMHQMLSLRVTNAFNAPTDRMYADGPTIAALHEALIRYWAALNEPALVQTLDNAVRRSRVKAMHQDILAQLHRDDITKADADELLADLYDPGEYDEVPGLAWIGGWAPAMICAWLAEKYRVVFRAERGGMEELEKKRTEELERRKAVEAERRKAVEAERMRVVEAERKENERRRMVEAEKKENERIRRESMRKESMRREFMRREAMRREAMRNEFMRRDFIMRAQNVERYLRELAESRAVAGGYLG